MILSALENLVGAPPTGLEFLGYLFSIFFVVLGLFFAFSLIRGFFGLFIK